MGELKAFANLEDNHRFISKEYMFIGTRTLGDIVSNKFSFFFFIGHECET